GNFDLIGGDLVLIGIPDSESVLETTNHVVILDINDTQLFLEDFLQFSLTPIPQRELVLLRVYVQEVTVGAEVGSLYRLGESGSGVVGRGFGGHDVLGGLLRGLCHGFLLSQGRVRAIPVPVTRNKT